MKQPKQFVNINDYIEQWKLLHFAGGHQESREAHQAGSQTYTKLMSRRNIFNIVTISHVVLNAYSIRTDEKRLIEIIFVKSILPTNICTLLDFNIMDHWYCNCPVLVE